MQRKLRMGMIGGGPGAFIGKIHRMAAALDQHYELVCGAFSSDPERSLITGRELGLPVERSYGSYREMFRRESELPVAERMEVVSIVTPNHLHFEPAKSALEQGCHVIMDKPMAFDLTEAKSLQEKVRESGKLLCLTMTYAGYPMIKEARFQVTQNKLGNIRKVFVEYPQGWLYNDQERSGNKQAAWRTDPTRSGLAGAIGDIGTHAFHLSEYVTGLRVSRLLAQLQHTVADRQLDDDGVVLFEFENGATGLLVATQVAAGEENNLRLRVYGDKGGLEWSHKDPNSLIFYWPDRPIEIYRAGNGYLSFIARHNTRAPAGHPEGFIEAFANHYRNFALTIQAQLGGEEAREEWLDYPGVDEGLRGMMFIEACVTSNGNWIDLE